MLFTYHCEGSPTVFARLKFSIKSWLILASWSILFMSCLYNPGMFLHSLSNKRAAVGLKVKYPNATATALRTSSLDDDNFFTSSSMAPVVTMASGIPARVWARLESKLLASTITLSLSEFNLRTSIVTPLAVKSTWSLSTMTRASTTICKKNKTDHKASVRIKLIFNKMCILNRNNCHSLYNNENLKEHCITCIWVSEHFHQIWFFALQQHHRGITGSWERVQQGK